MMRFPGAVLLLMLLALPRCISTSTGSTTLTSGTSTFTPATLTDAAASARTATPTLNAPTRTTALSPATPTHTHSSAPEASTVTVEGKPASPATSTATALSSPSTPPPPPTSTRTVAVEATRTTEGTLQPMTTTPTRPATSVTRTESALQPKPTPVPIETEVLPVILYLSGMSFADYAAFKSDFKEEVKQAIAADVATELELAETAARPDVLITEGNGLLKVRIAVDVPKGKFDQVEQASRDNTAAGWMLRRTRKKLTEYAFVVDDVTREVTDTPEPAAPIASCETRLQPGMTCTRGAQADASNICTCYESGYRCDTSRGTCRKLKVTNKDSGSSPSGSEIFGFLIVIFFVLFCVGNVIFYMKKNRLPYWVNNMCCTCPPVASCEEQSGKGRSADIEMGMAAARSSGRA